MNSPTKSVSKAPVDHSGILAWFINNPVAANLLMVCIIAAGLIGLNSVERTVFPTFASDTITVVVPVNSGALEEVETGVVEAIEAELTEIDGIDEVQSSATRTAGIVLATVHPDYDLSEVRAEIDQAVGSIRFPEDAEQYTISSASPEQPVIVMNLSGPVDETSLAAKALSIRRDLLELDNVAQVDITGLRQGELTVSISQDTLRSYGLTLQDISSAISATSINRGAGQLEGPGTTLEFRINETAQTAEDLANITILRAEGGQTLQLGDIAQILDTYTGAPDVSRLNGERTLSLSVLGGAARNPNTVVAEVEAYAAETSEQPENGMTLTLWQNETEALNARYGLVLDNLLTGLVLVLCILAVFLSPQLAFWVAVGIPVSFLGAMAIMPLETVDISLNFLSTFAFIIALGIVVDDAIVIAESIHDVAQEGEYEGKDAAVIGARRVATATTFGVLTTVAGFSALSTVSGGIGEALGTIGLVVIFILLASLVESKLVLPSHLSHLKRDKPRNADLLYLIRTVIEKGLQWWIARIYRPSLDIALRFRVTVFIGFVLFFVASVGLVVSGSVRTVFFPDIENDVIQGTVTLYPGTPATTAIEIADLIEVALDDTVEAMSANLSGNALENFVLSASSETQIDFTMAFDTSIARDFTTVEFATAFSDSIPRLSAIESISVSGGFGDAPDIALRLIGRDNDQLRAATIISIAELGRFEGVSEVKSAILTLQPEVTFSLTEEGKALGLTNAELSRQLRNAIDGQVVDEFLRQGEEVEVRVRLREANSDLDSFLSTFLIEVAPNTRVPASQIIEVTYQPALTQIDRIDGRRVSDITADVDKAEFSPGDVVAELSERLPDLLQDYPDVSYTFSGEAEEQAEAIQSLAIGVGMGLFAIFALLAIPLRSYSEPFLIFVTLPFGITGVFWGHLIMDIPVSLPSFFGIIALMGVVINDSLVLITYMNQQMEEKGISRREAIRLAGPKRFRAVLLTSMTTFMGLLPLMFEGSAQAQIMVPMAVSLGFGIVFATIFTLFLLPVIINLYDDAIVGKNYVLGLLRRITGNSSRTQGSQV